MEKQPQRNLLDQPSSRGARVGILLVILAIWLGFALKTAATTSAGVDEIPHLGAGLSYIAFQDFRMNPEHPLLMKYLYALPVYLFEQLPVHLEGLGGLDSERSTFYWGDQGSYGYSVLFGAPPSDVRNALLLGRLAGIATGLLCSLFVYLWLREFKAPYLIRCLGIALLLFYPEFLGYAAMMIFDIPQLLFFAAISYFAWIYTCRPNLKRGILLVLAGGIGTQIKITVSIYLGFYFLLIMLVFAILKNRRKVLHATSILVSTVILYLLLSWVLTGFQFHYTSEIPSSGINKYIPQEAHATSESFVQRLAHSLWTWKVLPESSLAVYNHLTGFEGRSYFFMGELRPRVPISYYFVSLLAKTPVTLLIVIILGPFAFFMRNRKGMRGMRSGFQGLRVLYLCSGSLAILAMLIYSGIGLGHRYLLFIYFPLVILAALVLWGIAQKIERERSVLSGVAILYIIEFALASSNPATYFNPFFATPYKASAYFQGSSTDWGQSIPQSAELLDEFEAKEVNLLLYGLNYPGAFGIPQYRWIDPEDGHPFFKPFANTPDPDLFSLISVNRLERARELYPKLYDREPDLLLHSHVLFFPLYLVEHSSENN